MKSWKSLVGAIAVLGLAGCPHGGKIEAPSMAPRFIPSVVGRGEASLSGKVDRGSRYRIQGVPKRARIVNKDDGNRETSIAIPVDPAEKITLTFDFPDFDVPATVDPESLKVLFDPPGLDHDREGHDIAIPDDQTEKRATPWKHHDIQGLDAPTLEFTSGEPYRLAMDLFFDRYEEGKSVREFTDKIEKLALVTHELHRPPTTLITWGTGLAFRCILESFSLRFTLFLDDGTPVRAVMNTVWKDCLPAPSEDQLKGKPRH